MNRVVKINGTWTRIGENLDSGWRVYVGESAEVLDLLRKYKVI